MHGLPFAADLLQSSFVIALVWLNSRTEKQAAAARELAELFLEQRDGLAWWLSFQGWEVDMEDGVWIGRPEGDPEEERLAR